MISLAVMDIGLKQSAIYRKLRRMAFALPWLGAAVIAAIGPPVPPPSARFVETVIVRTINATANVLAAARGARLSRPLPVLLVGQDRLRDLRQRLLPEPSTAAAVSDARDARTLYELLGLRENAQPAAEGSVARKLGETGFYDPIDRRVVVGNWADIGVGRLALDRDIGLAILDRRFDLRRFLSGGGHAARETNSDADQARSALVHGDATVQALEHLDPSGALPPPRALADITARTRAAIAADADANSPFDLARRLFVELDGLTFVAGVRERAPWIAVDGMWRKPPQSSEHILHPEKFERDESPENVGAALPNRLRGKWKIEFRDTLGELGTRTFLQRAVDPYRADRAAAGWGGDRAVLLRVSQAAGAEPAPECAAWMTIWDDDTNAEDFANEATSALAVLARVSDADVRSQSGRVRIVDGAGRVYALERRRRTVGLLFAAPRDAEGVFADLMSAVAARANRRVSGVQTRARAK
jgi:hypothetical protein